MRQVFRLFFLVGVIVGCIPEEEEEEEEVSIEISPVSDQLNPFLFDTSSYWIYQNEQSLTYDTVEVTLILKYVKSFVGGSNLGRSSISRSYYYKVHYNSTLRGEVIDFFLGSHISRNNIIYAQIYSQQMFTDTIQAYFPKLDSIHNTFKFNNNTYNDVKEVRTERAQYHTLFFADSVGIIRRKALVNNQIQVWNLIEFDANLFDRSY